MRTPIEKLARLIAKAPGEATVGELADKYHETAERILDAAAVLKLLAALDALDEAPITYISV